MALLLVITKGHYTIDIFLGFILTIAIFYYLTYNLGCIFIPYDMKYQIFLLKYDY